MKTNSKTRRAGDDHSSLVTHHSSLNRLHPNSRSWLTPGRHGGILGRPFGVYLAALLCITLSISFASTVSAQNVNVSGSTGADGSYATLQAAFAALNANTTQTSNSIQVNIVASTAETASAVLNNPTGGNWTSLTITPTTAVSVSGSIAGAPLIDLNGTQSVTIDGLNTGGNALSIVNTSTASTAGTSTIRFINDASNNTVKNCTIAGSTTSATLGTIFFSTGTTTGNQNNTIQNNTITQQTGNFPVNAIYSLGTSAAIFNGGTITGNNIQDYFSATLATAGVNLGATGNSAWTITNNKFFQTATRVYTTANTHRGIFVGTGAGYAINGNTIGFADANGNGTTNIVGNSVALTGTFPSLYTATGVANATIYRAIDCAFTTGGTVSNIQANTIAGIALYTSSAATAAPGILCGINISSGNASVGTTTANTIGATAGGGGASPSSLYAATTVTGGTIVGISASNSTAGSTITIQNNTMGSIDAVGTTATVSGGFTGIDVPASAGNFTISNNTIGNGDADNIRTGYTLNAGSLSNNGTLTSTTGGTAATVFIRCFTTGATANLSNNTLRGWATSSTVQTLTGITNIGATTTTISINNNSLGTGARGWARYAFANSGALTGILDSGAGAAAALNINSNDIRGITYAALSTGANTYINCSAVPLSFTANLNTFTNLNVNTSGTVTFILMTYTQSTSTGTKTVTNNSIVTAFNRGGASGSVLLVSDNGSSVTGVLTTVQNNNFSSINVLGTSTITGINLTDGGTAPTKTITGNILNNWTAITGAINAVNVTYWNGASSLSSNTITNLTGQSTVTGMTLGSTVNTANPLNVSLNIVSNLSSTGTGGAVTGITCSNTSPVINISNNTINTLSSTGASSTVAGIAITAATTTNVSGNTINTLSGSGATSPLVNGISVSAGTTVNVSKNKIYDLSESGAITTTSPAINGMLLSGGTTVNTFNNLIGDLRTPAASLTDAIRGISVTSVTASATYNVSFNSVRIAATSTGANFGTTGIFHTTSATATTATLNLRDNALVNLSTPAGTGLAAAYRRSSTTLTNYGSASNNNDFHAGTPGVSRLIFYDGTNSDQTIAAYKARVAPIDSASFTENPPFLSTVGSSGNFLHIDPTVATQLESGGIPVSGITDDFDGNTRNASTPDVGADEFSGTPLDLTPPAISYAALGNDLVAITRSFMNVTITDANSVNTTAGTRPRVYYKKSTNANIFNDNTNATDGWKFAEASGAGGSPFSFTIDYSLLFGGGGVSVGDNIQYFVVAQDLASTPNVGINSGTFASQPSSVNLTAAAFPIGGTINSYNIVNPLSGTFNVGVGQTYADLTAAISGPNGLNNTVITGSVTLLLTDSSYGSGPGDSSQAFPLTINANPGSSATNTITIKPASGVTSTISGSATGALITIKASYVLIDGSNSGGTDRSLTITNTSATTPSVILFGSTGTTPITNDTLKNCVIINGVNTSSAVVVSDGTTLGAAGYFNNITIQNNSVQKAFRGILAVAIVSGTNGSGTVITQNDLNTSGANSIRLNPIAVQGTNGVTISNNNLGNISDANAEIPVGILLASGVDNASVTGNTIASVVTTNTTTSASVEGILVSAGAATTSINVSNNTISTLTSSGTGAGLFYGIGCFSPNATISNNMVSSLTNTAGTTFWGIAGSGVSNSTISGNSVSTMSCNVSSCSPLGINVQGASATVNVNGNTVTNVTTGASASSSTPTGILLSGTLDGITVQNNNVNGVSNGSTGTYGVWGIRVFGGNNHIIKNNFVSNVNHDMTGGASFSTSFGAFGLVLESGTGHKVYHNSVNLYGLMPGTATSSNLTAAFSMVTTASTGCDVRNNIFANNITGGTTSIAHVSVYLPSGGTSAMNLTDNNNAYYFGTNASTQGAGQAGTTAGTNFFATLAALRAYTSTLSAAGTNDNASQASTAAVPFTSNSNLHINTGLTPTPLESGGASQVSTGVVVDIDGDTRPGPIGSVNGGATAPDIGADEFDGVPIIANDLSATAFISPTNGGNVIAGATFAPQASFTNNGSAAQTNVTVRYRICTDGSCTTELYNNTQIIPSINAFASTTVTFANTSLSAGTYTIKARSELAGDQVPANDEITGSITAQAPLNGGYTVGAGGNYPSLTQAVNALNNLGVGGPVTITLLENLNAPETVETYPIQINAIPGASSTNTVTIKPNSAGITMTGSGASALIILNGSDWVTIDGSSNGTSSRDLTMTNTNAGASSAVVWLQTSSGADAATNNTIKNLNLVGSGNTQTLIGVGSGGTTISITSLGTGNNNNTFQNNNISKTQYGIYSQGASAANKNTGNVITQNLINAASPNNIQLGAILVGFENNIQITRNNISNVSTSGSNDAIGIALGLTAISTTGFTGNDVTNAVVTQNNISGVASLSTTGFSAVGITVASTTTGTNLIANNYISGVISPATSPDFTAGIFAGGGTGSTTQIYANSVSLTGARGSGTTFPSYGIAIGGSNPTVDARDNIFFNTQTGGTGKSYAIGLAYSTYTSLTSDYNDLFVSGASSFVGQTGGLGTTGTDRSNLAAWQAQTGTDAHSISADPQFVSATDLHLVTSPIPPVSRAGVTIAGITTDFDGDTRQSPPDIGADEITTYILTYTAGANGSITGTTPQEVISGGSGTAVTAVANACYHFVNWSDGSTQNPRTDINVLANLSVTANFAITTYTLTYTAGPNGTVTGASPQTVNCGGNGTAVTAVPNACYHFVNWSDGSTQNPRTDTNVTMDISVTANFAINTYTLTYTAGPNGSISGTSPQTVNCGSDGTAVTAVPNACYHFVNWSDGSTANPRTDTNVMMDINVTANFAINTYTLTYTAGAHGSISGTSPQTVNCGGSGSAVTAVPDAHYHFVNWSDGSTANPRTDTNVQMDINVTANFAIDTYTLTYTAGPHGSISGTSPQTVPYGGSGTPVSAVPDTGYHFVNWSDGSTQNPRTDTNVQMDISVTANFDINTYTVTYDGNGNTGGTAPVDPNSPYNYNSTVTVLGPGSLVRTGYTFSHWSTAANDSGTSYSPNDTFNITANTILYAQWTLIPTCQRVALANDGSTSGNARAPQTRNRYERSVYLIKASELAAAGFSAGNVISSIGWNYQTGGVAGSAPLVIYMQNTTDTTNTKSTTWATAISGMAVVHNATTAVPAAAGPFDITFSGGSPSSFTYTGGGLYVAFDWGQYTGTLGTTTVVWCNSTGLVNGLLGAQSNAAPPTTVAASSFRPETRLNGVILANDAAVTAVYSLGEIPYCLVPAQVIKAVVTNNGTNTLTNLSVTLNITGADTFTDTQTVPSLASCGGQAVVTFMAYTPSALGSDTVTVSIPSDDVNTNNSLSRPLNNTQLNYSYKYPGSTATGGVGLTGATGAFVAKMTTSAANAVTAVKLEFAATSATTYRVAIYGDSGSGTPSTTPLYVDAADRTVTVAGPVTITLPSPVAVGPGNFYVGLQQTNTTNAALSYDAETPIRSGAFYLASPVPVTAWFDFAPGNNFKLNIGAILQTGCPGNTLTYDGNGNTGGTPPVDPNSPYNYNATVTVLGPGSLVKAGYTFSRWNTAANGSGTSYNPGAMFNIQANTTLFAQWLSSNANLSNLILSAGTLMPAFNQNITSYTATVSNSVSSMTVTPFAVDANSTIRVNGMVVPSGMQSQNIPLSEGNNLITIDVTAQDTTTMRTYTVTVHRTPAVSNGNDSGPGSLRQALTNSQDGDVITFGSFVEESPQHPAPDVPLSTVTLTSGELLVTTSITIMAPGANALTVTRDPMAPAFRIFHVVPGKTVTISGMTISGGNSGNANGGGILNDHATLAVAGCTLAGNVNALGYGGGIYNDGSSGAADLTILNSTLSGNASPSGSGGGIFNEGSNGIAHLTINNSTLSGNSSSPGTGGAIVNKGASGTATLTIANSTLAGNSADALQGGGIWNQSASLTLGNTILKKGSTGANIANSGGTVTSAGYNLSDDNGAGFLTNTGDQINTDPMLGPLKDNGGTTLTHAPLIGSPAIDQGKRNTIPALTTNVDQRGFVRPVDDPAVANAAGGDTSDIGAVELVVGVHPTSAVSRKTHTGIGDFDVDLPMLNFASSPLGVECRAGGATGVYKLIFFFSEPVSFSSAAVTSGAGSVDSTSGLGTSQVTINLINVADVQTITVGLFDVDNGTNSGDVGTRMGMLIGDVNANRSVNAADVSLVKSNSGSGVSQANFRSDVNANGAISAADVSLVKSKSGNGLP